MSDKGKIGDLRAVLYSKPKSGDEERRLLSPEVDDLVILCQILTVTG
jgi:hypothetical protein